MSHPAPGGSPSRAAEEGAIDLEVRAADGTAVSFHGRARTSSFDPAFTPRQREILGLVADGSSNAEIAAMLGISRRTVEKHLETIHMKAGTATRARLVAFARIHQRLDGP